MAFYYAVRVGKSPGIYNNWPDCAENVLRYPGAIYKKFSTLVEAKDFLKQTHSSFQSPKTRVLGEGKRKLDQHQNDKTDSDLAIKRRPGSELIAKCSLLKSCDKLLYSAVTYSHQGCIVYCDGCCYNNGNKCARAGIGVYWSQPKLPAISERLSGKQTNQRAELVAACRALESALEHKLVAIEVRTDSCYTINTVSNWVSKWKLNGWKTIIGEDVKNKEDIIRLDDLNSQLEVKWTHVRGHSNEFGNEKADELAKAGASLEL